MKYHGCILEFTDERNKELLRVFREVIDEQSFIDLTEIFGIVVGRPCSRFWVSEERAFVVISAMLKGKPILNALRPNKREMFQEIYNRVIELRKTNRDATLFELVIKVVNSPAPKFYLTARSAMETYFKINRGFYEKQFRRY